MSMKFIILLIFVLSCSSKPKEESLLLGREEAFLQKLENRTLLIPQSFDINSVSESERDLTLKGLINYYPFADVKLVTTKIQNQKLETSSQNIEKEMKAENDQIIKQMNDLIKAFRMIPPEQMNRTQESLNQFSLQIRRRQQTYESPTKCFNDRDCSGEMRCLTAGFCTK